MARKKNKVLSSNSFSRLITGGDTDFDPSTYDLLADFDNSRFYWGRRHRTISDLTANGDGSYDLSYTGLGFWNGAATVVVDVSYADTYAVDGGSDPSGTAFSWTGSGGTRLEFDPYNISSTRKLWRPTVTPGPTFVDPLGSGANDLGFSDGHGRHRIIVILQNGQKVSTLVDNYLTKVDAGSSISMSSPTKLTFGRRALDGTQRLTNATLHRVAIYRGALPQSALDIISADGVKPPVHFIGDSFLNLSYLKEAVMVLNKNAGYVGFTQDGVGGSTLLEQFVRFQSTPKWYNCTLVIMDGGFDGTFDEAKIAINGMLGKTRHNRYLYIQSNPQVENGNPTRDAWNARDANMLAYYGANHYCPTLSLMQSYASADAADIANVANGLWPATLMSDTIHPNSVIEPPNTISGTNALGTIVYNRLRSLDYL